METFSAMFGIVLLFALLLIPGFILGKQRLIEKSAMVSFSNILMYIAMPFLVVTKLLEIDVRTLNWSEVTISIILPFVIEGLLLAICMICFSGADGRKKALRFCSVFPNVGFLGIPLAAAMWPNNPEIVLFVSFYNLINTFTLLTFGVFVLSGDKKSINPIKCLLSPATFAIMLGFIGSYFKVADHFPTVLIYSTTLSNLTTPLAMITLGFELSGLHLIRMWKSAGIYASAFIKLIVSPLLALGILLILKYVLVIPISEFLINAMLVATAVSTAASASAMSKKYDADAQYAATLTLANTLLCMFTMPLMYTLFNLILIT